MNPGLLTIPFVALALFLGLRRHPLLLAIWPFSYLVLLTFRTRLGGASLYWSDVVTVAVLLGFWLPHRNAPRRSISESWGLILFLSLSVGALSTLVRHRAILEPGFLMLRWVLALSPFFVLPWIIRDRRLMRAFASGVVIGACVIGLVTTLQALSPDWALSVDAFFYGVYSHDDPTTFSPRVEQIVADDGIRRLYAMYGNSTVLAGAGLMAALLAWALAELSPSLRLCYIAVPPALFASLLSYSRHAMLALAVFLVTLVVLDRRRALKPLIVLGGVGLALFLGLLSSEFMAMRLAKGGFSSDPNLRARVIDGPLQLAERLSREPSIGFIGVGLGTDHVLGLTAGQPQQGFVSNGFLLHLFYGGFLPFVVFCAAFVASFRRSLRLPSPWRPVFAASLLAAAIVLMSDNYGYFHFTITFVWACIMALAFHLSAAPSPATTRDPANVAEAGLPRRF